MITENEVIVEVNLKNSTLMLKLYCLNFTEALIAETFIVNNPCIFIGTGLAHISRSIKI